MTTPPIPPPAPRLWLGRHPSLWLGTLGAALALGTAIGLPGLSGGQVAAINAGVLAVVSAVWAWSVRPIAPAVYTGAVGAIAGVGAAYGLHVPSETVGAVQAVVVQVLTLIAWGQVSPAGASAAVTPPAPPPVLVDQAAAPADAGGQPSAARPQRGGGGWSSTPPSGPRSY